MSISYDPASYELAEHFLADQPNVKPSDIDELAQHIQSYVEDWLNDFEAKQQKSQQAT